MVGDISVHWVGQAVDYRQGYELLLVKSIAGCERFRAKPFEVEFEKWEPATFIPGPTMSLHAEEAKQLMQVLWDLGVRPNLGGPGEESAALRQHIKFAESVVDRLFTAVRPPQILADGIDITKLR